MALMDDLGKVLQDGKVDTSDLLGLLGKVTPEQAQKAAGSIDPNQLTQIMGLLKNVDLSKVDIEGLAKQFGLPSELISQAMAMLKK